MLHKAITLRQCLGALLLLGFLSGCSSSSSSPSVKPQEEAKVKPGPQNLDAQQPVVPRPDVAPGGPQGVAPSSPTQGSVPAGQAPSPGYNTRPVGPYGIRPITLGLNDLRQAGLLLVAYYNENNAWPRNDSELRDALREMPVVYKALQTGDYIFVPLRAPHVTPGPQSVLIYEKLPDKSGIRLVLFGDASVRRMNVGEFNQLKLPPP